MAWGANQSIIELALDVDLSLDKFHEEAPETNNTHESVRKVLGELKKKEYPKHYRKLLKTRSQFECTNDLLSSYSFIFLAMLNFKYISDLIERKKNYSRSFALRTYRGVWTLYAQVTSSLIRVSSNDLRFWLTDAPYVERADEFAQKEFERITEFLYADDWGGKRFHLLIESPNGLEEFWQLNEK